MIVSGDGGSSKSVDMGMPRRSILISLAAVSKPSPFGRGKGEGALVAGDSPSPRHSPGGRGGVLKLLLEISINDSHTSVGDS